MTELLEQAISALSECSDDVQDAIASALIWRLEQEAQERHNDL